MSEEAQLAAAETALDPFAASLALSGASREQADAFLRKQSNLIDDQRHHLAEDTKQIDLRILELRLGVLLRLATLIVGLAVAGGASWLVWQASRADGLRVESFSVPPDLAANGLTGQVVAARLIDRLSELQSQTNTGRPARTYSNGWGDKTIRLEIPETGVSLEELDSWLRAKLGHETSLSGEVLRSGSTITLTARAEGNGAVSVSGPEADITALTGKLAEAVYRLTQPYRYAIYLMRHENRPADAAPIFRQLALNGNAEERRWSYNMWANATEVATNDYELGLSMYQKAHQADPDAVQPMTTLAQDLNRFGRVEEAHQVSKENAELQRKNNPAAKVPGPDPGNYLRSLIAAKVRAQNGVRGLSRSVLAANLIQPELNLHEFSAARANLAEMPADVDSDPIRATAIALQIGIEMEDWHGVLAHAGEMTNYLKIYPRNRHYTQVALAPLLALAYAHLSDFAAAERLIAPMPADCEPCTVTRGWIAELQHQRPRADFWFARATHQAPSLPFAFHDWGRALLARGEADAAILRFQTANQKGPHFADPLEGWGEALMAKNQSHLALAKFEEANKYAPNWGRLHLKWGEALGFAGKPTEARAEFARAASLDLTPSEKAELAGQHHA